MLVEFITHKLRNCLRSHLSGNSTVLKACHNAYPKYTVIITSSIRASAHTDSNAKGKECIVNCTDVIRRTADVPSSYRYSHMQLAAN
jgi:hypothetical protein